MTTFIHTDNLACSMLLICYFCLFVLFVFCLSVCSIFCFVLFFCFVFVLFLFLFFVLFCFVLFFFFRFLGARIITITEPLPDFNFWLQFSSIENRGGFEAKKVLIMTYQGHNKREWPPYLIHRGPLTKRTCI